MDLCHLVCLMVSQHDGRYVDGGFCCVVYSHPIAASVNADIEETLYGGPGRWFTVTALAYYLTQTDTLATLTGNYAIPGYPADIGGGIVLTAYCMFA